MNAITKFYKIRIFIIFIPFTIILCLILYRLFSIQILKHKAFQKIVNKQHHAKITIEPDRGIIYDCNMNPLVLNTKANSLFAIPSEIKNKKTTAYNLAPLINESFSCIYKKINQPKKKFVWIKRKLNKDTENNIQNLKIKGLHFVKETQRVYPHKTLACHILGFVDIDNKGLSGIEKSLDSYIKGIPGWMIMEKDAQNQYFIPSKCKSKNPEGGYSLKLTIDLVIQYIVESELDVIWEKFKPNSAFVIVMDPKSGKILAISNRPNFDPNNSNFYPAYTWKNRAIIDIFEPGSTMKMFLAASALNEKIFTPEEKIFCENGVYSIGRHKIHDHGKKYSWLTFTQVLAYSSNIGMVKIGTKLGKEKLYNCFFNFGFGQKTNLLLPGEMSGVLRKPNNWSSYSISAISIGQEIGITGIQLIKATSILANNGILKEPYLVESVLDNENHIIKEFVQQKQEKQVEKQILSSQTINAINKILQEVVISGTGTKASLKYYSVAGKTGTSQKIDPNTGTYSNNKYISSFIGYVPSNDPQLVILVVVDEPKGAYYGGEVGAPSFKNIAYESLKHLKIIPSVSLK
ncbi:MAG: penicillin-binding protein 2 [bacterium]